MFGERGPSASDPVLHLSGFLVHECDHLLQKPYFSFGRENLDMHFVDLNFPQPDCYLVCQDLGFASVDFEPRRFCKSAIIF